jgi:hypothetical protein
MNRFAIALASATALTAIFVAAAPVGAHATVLDECPLNEHGQTLLKTGLQSAQYDVTSRAYRGFYSLGFTTAEFARPNRIR